jgi:hypothetical protein
MDPWQELLEAGIKIVLAHPAAILTVAGLYVLGRIAWWIFTAKVKSMEAPGPEEPRALREKYRFYHFLLSEGEAERARLRQELARRLGEAKAAQPVADQSRALMRRENT